MKKEKLSRQDRALLSRLSQSFQQIASPDGMVDDKRLKQLLGIKDDQLAQRFVNLFDPDGEGRIKEKAFLSNLRTVMAGSEREKLAFVFKLYDTNGKVIAYRQIRANDYLDSSIDVEAGMTPDSPIHFVLEVADTGTDAVSFEFDFL